MSIDLGEGLRKIAIAQSAVISHRVTEDAQNAKKIQEAKIESGAAI